MATSEDYSKSILDKDRTPAQASNYEAKQREVNANTDTVRGQLNSLLDDDSKYIDRARTSGKQYVADRGLLNSSMGAQATEAAAIDAALPIAQQDAETYLKQGLTNQDATNVARSTNSQLNTNVSMSNAGDELKERGEALGNLGMLEKEGMQNESALERAQLAEAGQTERQGMQNDASLERLKLTELGEAQRLKEKLEVDKWLAELSELSQTERQQIAADVDVQTNEARLRSQEVIANKELAEDARKFFSESYDKMTRQNYVELSKVATDPDLSADQKNRIMANQNRRYVNDVKLLSDLYGYEIDVKVQPDNNVQYAPTPAPAPPPKQTSNNNRNYDPYNNDMMEEHSCFLGDTCTVNSEGDLIKVRDVREGDKLMGANGSVNRVNGVEKVPVAGRVLWKLKDHDYVVFTGEHPFLLANGKWGAFNKAAMDNEIIKSFPTFVELKDGTMKQVIATPLEFTDDLVTQIKMGDLGQNIDGEDVRLDARYYESDEEFVYTFLMGETCTWNVEGTVVSGLALIGTDRELVDV